MIIVTTDEIPGQRVVKVLGAVQGSAVQTTHLGMHFLAALRQLAGGEVNAYSGLMEKARTEAVQRMTQSAEAMGANAVVGMRFASSTITAGVAEILVYGTAVVVE